MNNKYLLQRMKKNPFFVVGFILVVFIILVTVFAGSIVKYDPIANSLMERFLPPQGFEDGFNGHVFGTDEIGRDVFTRLLLGARYSLLIAFSVVALQVVIGSFLGILAGYFGGFVDTVIMRLCDIVLAVPNLILAIAVMAVVGASISNLVVILTLSGWVQCCKVTRNNVRVIRNKEFVHASRVMGAKNLSIMFGQILPNVTTHIIIIASQRIGSTILLEAGLSFLSLGIQPPIPSWGNMISSGRQYLATSPWLAFAPGIALMLTVLAFNFLGDGLRDVLDPKRIK